MHWKLSSMHALLRHLSPVWQSRSAEQAALPLNNSAVVLHCFVLSHISPVWQSPESMHWKLSSMHALLRHLSPVWQSRSAEQAALPLNNSAVVLHCFVLSHISPVWQSLESMHWKLSSMHALLRHLSPVWQSRSAEQAALPLNNSAVVLHCFVLSHISPVWQSLESMHWKLSSMHALLRHLSPVWQSRSAEQAALPLNNSAVVLHCFVLSHISPVWQSLESMHWKLSSMHALLRHLSPVWQSRSAEQAALPLNNSAVVLHCFVLSHISPVWQSPESMHPCSSSIHEPRRHFSDDRQSRSVEQADFAPNISADVLHKPLSQISPLAHSFSSRHSISSSIHLWRRHFSAEQSRSLLHPLTIFAPAISSTCTPTFPTWARVSPAEPAEIISARCFMLGRLNVSKPFLSLSPGLFIIELSVGLKSPAQPLPQTPPQFFHFSCNASERMSVPLHPCSQCISFWKAVGISCRAAGC